MKNISERTHIFAEVMSFKELGKMGIDQSSLKFRENLVNIEIYGYDVVFAKKTKSNLGLLAVFNELKVTKNL